MYAPGVRRHTRARVNYYIRPRCPYNIIYYVKRARATTTYFERMSPSRAVYHYANICRLRTGHMGRFVKRARPCFRYASVRARYVLVVVRLTLTTSWRNQFPTPRIYCSGNAVDRKILIRKRSTINTHSRFI